MKKTVSLWIDESLWDEAKIRKINISDLLERVLRTYIAMEETEVEDVLITIAQEQIAVLEKRLIELEQQRAQILTRKKTLESSIEELKKKAEEARKSREIAKLIRQLNQVIVLCEYDVERIKTMGSDIIRQLNEKGFVMDDERLKKQIRYLRSEV